MKKTNTPLLLAILDGIALNPDPRHNAVAAAHTPVLDGLLKNFPWTTLCSSGERVGLPGGQMGNSEVGHLTIGSGRVVEQDLTRINKTSRTNTFPDLPLFSETIAGLKKSGSSLHLIGLSSTGGVHSELGHLVSIIHGAAALGAPSIVLHLITDGRDRPQKEAIREIASLEERIHEISHQFPESNILIATLIGRYYAMDRDTRWERTEKAYRLFTEGSGTLAASVREALESSYANAVFDEFIDAFVIEQGNPALPRGIHDHDAVLFYNFRADRMRQIVSAFFKTDWSHFTRDRHPELSKLLTLTEYDKTFPCEVLFPPQVIKNSLGEVLARHGYSQLRIAETEKYPHVTYFFNGGNEVSFPDEERIVIPSPRDVATYDLKPEMSAPEITEALIKQIEDGKTDVIILNYANCDMVGHTGNFEAAVKAVETVDSCLGNLLNALEKKNGVAIVTADHGNADQMIDYETGEAHTYHTTHPVPFIIFNLNRELPFTLNEGGSLADISPTILDILGIEIPKEMSGSSLITEK
jgi:2,3-bisphosphoglycerate-independent phosphoglycerate mutase